MPGGAKKGNRNAAGNRGKPKTEQHRARIREALRRRSHLYPIWAEDWENRKRRDLGLRPGQYDALFEAQGGECAICGAKDVKFRVDHDHVTGRVRGLLCNRCNLLLGQVEPLLRAIQRYLKCV